MGNADADEVEVVAVRGLGPGRGLPPQRAEAGAVGFVVGVESEPLIRFVVRPAAVREARAAAAAVGVDVVAPDELAVVGTIENGLPSI